MGGNWGCLHQGTSTANHAQRPNPVRGFCGYFKEAVHIQVYQYIATHEHTKMTRESERGLSGPKNQGGGNTQCHVQVAQSKNIDYMLRNTSSISFPSILVGGELLP